MQNGVSSPNDLLKRDAARSELNSTDSSLNGAAIWRMGDAKVGYDATKLSADFVVKLQGLALGEFLTDSFIYGVRLDDSAAIS